MAIRIIEPSETLADLPALLSASLTEPETRFVTCPECEGYARRVIRWKIWGDDPEYVEEVYCEECDGTGLAERPVEPIAEDDDFFETTPTLAAGLSASLVLASDAIDFYGALADARSGIVAGVETAQRRILFDKLPPTPEMLSAIKADARTIVAAIEEWERR